MNVRCITFAVCYLMDLWHMQQHLCFNLHASSQVHAVSILFKTDHQGVATTNTGLTLLSTASAFAPLARSICTTSELPLSAPACNTVCPCNTLNRVQDKQPTALSFARRKAWLLYATHNGCQLNPCCNVILLFFRFNEWVAHNDRLWSCST